MLNLESDLEQTEHDNDDACTDRDPVDEYSDAMKRVGNNKAHRTIAKRKTIAKIVAKSKKRNRR